MAIITVSKQSNYPLLSPLAPHAMPTLRLCLSCTKIVQLSIRLRGSRLQLYGGGGDSGLRLGRAGLLLLLVWPAWQLSTAQLKMRGEKQQRQQQQSQPQQKEKCACDRVADEPDCSTSFHRSARHEGNTGRRAGRLVGWLAWLVGWLAWLGLADCSLAWSKAIQYELCTSHNKTTHNDDADDDDANGVRCHRQKLRKFRIFKREKQSCKKSAHCA